MRRSEKSHTQSRSAVDTFEHGTSGAFAVGTSHVDEAELLLRIARERGELEGVFQPELRAEKAEAVEKLDGFGIGHVRLGSSAFDGEGDVVVGLVG